MTETTKTSDSITFNKYTQYFKDKEIGNFLDEFLDKQADRIIKDLNNFYEAGDLKGCNDLIKKINENRAFKIFSKEKKIILLDIIIKKILPNFIDSPSDILSFLGKIRFLIPQNYKMDWKFFYSFYYLLYKKNKSDISNYITFFKSLHKFIDEDSLTQEDYNIIKTTFIEDLIISNKSYAISIFMYFLPKKWINEDENLQFKIFQLFKNCKNYFIGSCCMFSKILKKNGKLHFSKDEKVNDEYIKAFIKYYFTNLNLYLIDDSSIKNQNYSSPMFANKDSNKKKQKFDHSVIDVLLGLLFNQSLKKYAELIDEHLKIILNNKHLYIKENSNTTVAKNFIKFLNEFVYRIYNLFYRKKYEEKIYKKIRTSPIDYKDNEYIFAKLLNIMNYFSICFKKIFLYENSDTFTTLQKLFTIIGSIEVDDNYMKELLKNMDFDEYLRILDFFKENIETKSVKFINKLQTILPLLLSKYVYTNYNKVREFIKDVIILSSSSLNSANIDFDINILTMFGTYFYDIKNKLNKSRIYESLIPLINEATMEIMNKLIAFLDLVCLRNNTEFSAFITSMRHYLDKEAQSKISKKYADYIEEHEIESKYLVYYFNVIDEEEHPKIFKYIFNNMIYVDNSNDSKINDNFLYPEKDDELKINVKYCSLEIIEKQIQKYQNIFSLLNFAKILTNEKDIKKLYQIYFTLINREEISFRRLGIELFKNVLNSLLDCKISNEENNEEKDLIEYPSKENVLLVNNIYKKIVLPYEKYIIENINGNKKESNFKKLEQILFIYIMLIQSVSITKLNIVLMLNEEDSNIKEYQSIQNQLNMYKEYKQLVNYSLQIIEQIYEYNKNNEQKLFINQNILSAFDNIIINKLAMNSKGMTDKRTNLREKKSFLFKYFNIREMKHFWLKKKITVMNYNYFSLMKNFISKDDIYYKYLYIYSLNLSAENHPPHIISIGRNFMYALNKDKIKELYEKIFTEYKQILDNIKEELETDKNVMKNISTTFFEFCLTYISLFPTDIISVLIKILTIYGKLKIKKYSNIEKSIGFIVLRMRAIVYLPVCSEKKYKKLINKYSERNEIISNESKKLIKINDKIIENNNKYYSIIRMILEMVIKGLDGDNDLINKFFGEEKKDNKSGINLLSDREKIIVFLKLKEYILEVIDKNEELYQKVIKFTLDIIFSKFVPISSKYFWIKIFHSFVKEEFCSYKEYKWITFKSEEDFKNNWEKLKYEIKGKKKNEILPVPVKTIRLTNFNFLENSNDIKYNIDINKFIEILKEINEWSEEQALIMSENKKTLNNEIFAKMLGFNKDNKGLEFKRIKIFYYMMQLKYINFDKNDFIKNYKISDNENKDKNESIKNLTTVLEFLSAKYYYMLNKNIFNEESKKELWEILKYYTNGVNKKVDEKIISFFNFIFTNCSLGNIINIFKDSNYNEYSLDFVSKLYNLYLQSFSKLKKESNNLFDKNKTNELINQIISSDQNLILYSNELKNMIKIYYEINGYLTYDYSTFEDKYTKDTINYFKELLSKDFSKRSRYVLYEIYSTYFYCLNDDLQLFNSIMPKIALCINEFKTNDKVDLGSDILQAMEGKFRNYNKEIDLKLLCELVSEILKKEENSKDTNKLLYLQTINIVFNNQKHFNLNKYTSKEIFDYLYKIFSSIKNEDLKLKFASVFVSYFNDLPDEDNIKFIKEYKEKVLKTQEKNNYIYLLMSQLLRFRMSLPEYIQSFIISLKSLYKEKKEIKPIIDSFLKIAMDNYHGTYIYMKNNISSKCKVTLEEMTIEKSYFV